MHLLIKQQLNVKDLILLNSEIDRRIPNKTVMYFLWFFLGNLGVHRFYLGDIGQGIAMLLTLGGLGIWTIIDLFFIGKRHRWKIEQLEAVIMQEMNLNNKYNIDTDEKNMI